MTRLPSALAFALLAGALAAAQPPKPADPPAYEKRGDWSSARDHYAAVLADDAKNGAVRQRFAAVVFQLGRPDEAFKELQQARQDDPAVDLPELRMAMLNAATSPDPAKTEEW